MGALSNQQLLFMYPCIIAKLL